MHALGFDILEIVDERGEVLAAGHFPGRVGDTDPEALAVARRVPGQGAPRSRAGASTAAARATCSRSRRRARCSGRSAIAARAWSSSAGASSASDFVARLAAVGARLYAADGTLVAGARPRRRGAGRSQVIELRRPRRRRRPRASRSPCRTTSSTRRWPASPGPRRRSPSAASCSRCSSAPSSRGASAVRCASSPTARAPSPRGSLDASVPVRTRDEVGELAATFNDMIRDLAGARDELVRAERVAAWREIAQRIAHEIKNPLTPIQMAIETLQRAHQQGRAAVRRALRRIGADHPRRGGAAQAHRAEFSSFARMPAPTLAPVDVVRGGRQRAGALQGRRDAARADAAARSSAGARRQGAAHPGRHQPRRERARCASPAQGRIRVLTRVADGRVELEVADDGPGLSDEARAKLFTPYFTTKPSGTGLGLAIVHRIVSDHGGEIRVGASSAPGAAAPSSPSRCRAPTSVPSRKFASIRLPRHPRPLRCSSLKYLQVFAVVAPRARGAATSSVHANFRLGTLGLSDRP